MRSRKGIEIVRHMLPKRDPSLEEIEDFERRASPFRPYLIQLDGGATEFVLGPPVFLVTNQFLEQVKA